MAKRRYKVIHEDIFGKETNLGYVNSKSQAINKAVSFKKKQKNPWF